jgi:hypothetical protein
MFKSLTEPTHGSLHIRVAKKMKRHVCSRHETDVRSQADDVRSWGKADLAVTSADFRN